MSTATAVTASFVVDGSVEVRTDIKVDLAELIRKHPDEYAAVKMDGYAPWERPVVFLDNYLRDTADSPDYGIDVDSSWDEMDVDLPRWSEEKFRALRAVCPEADPDGLSTFGQHGADRDSDVIGPFMKCRDCGKVWRLPLSPMEQDDLADDVCPEAS